MRASVRGGASTASRVSPPATVVDEDIDAVGREFGQPGVDVLGLVVDRRVEAGLTVESSGATSGPPAIPITRHPDPGELPGSPVARAAAEVVRELVWQGKVVDPGGTSLRNRLTPLGVRAVAAAVRQADSLVDGRPCTVFDYSATSVVARGVRDEVRLVAPGLYLGVVWLFGRRIGWFAVRERRGAPMSPAGRWFATLAVAVDDRRRWDRFPTWVAIALIKGIRDHMRTHNLYGTDDAGSTPALDPEPDPRWLGARTVDGSYNDLSCPAMGMAGTRFGRNVPGATPSPSGATG